jgi:hypothetical protein
LEAEKPNQFFDVYYGIPEKLLHDKQQITNNSNLTFSNVNKDSGISTPSNSNHGCC